MIRNNDVDFVKVIFDRLTPNAHVRVIYDWRVSLQATIEVENPGYKIGYFDLKLVLDRYERYDLATADSLMQAELIACRVIGAPPPVSVTPARPDADPFAKPVGLPDPGRMR